jgi:D-alanine-D-alanine ligase
MRLVVLFGGRSAEHDISCISAGHVLDAISRDRYEVEAIGITRDGAFVRVEPPAGGVGTGLSAAGEPVDPYALLDAAAADARSGSRPTVVLPVLHGPNGEDGTVQGLLEVVGVPYVGAGVLGSAVSMDKAMAKTVLTAHGIAQVPWRELHHHEPFGEPGAAEAFDSLGDTVFVKPANMGSSIGVAKVRRPEGPAALLEAVKDAFRYDDVVVLEAGITGRELEIAVLGNDDPRASEVGEITAGADFYDYSDKYFDGNAETTVPADLPAEVAAAARELAVRTFRALRCQGMARVDLFLTDDGDLLVNEVNTIPGFTPISMYPKMWQASGLGYPELIDELVRLAMERHTLRSSREVNPD